MIGKSQTPAPRAADLAPESKACVPKIAPATRTSAIKKTTPSPNRTDLLSEASAPMFDYNLAGAIGPGTTTLTRKASLVRGPPRTCGIGGNGVNGIIPNSPTQQDQALEWSQRQQPALGSRPHKVKSGRERE